MITILEEEEKGKGTSEGDEAKEQRNEEGVGIHQFQSSCNFTVTPAKFRRYFSRDYAFFCDNSLTR